MSLWLKWPCPIQGQLLWAVSPSLKCRQYKYVPQNAAGLVDSAWCRGSIQKMGGAGLFLLGFTCSFSTRLHSAWEASSSALFIPTGQNVSSCCNKMSSKIWSIPQWVIAHPLTQLVLDPNFLQLMANRTGRRLHEQPSHSGKTCIDPSKWEKGKKQRSNNSNA